MNLAGYKEVQISLQQRNICQSAVFEIELPNLLLRGGQPACHFVDSELASICSHLSQLPKVNLETFSRTPTNLPMCHCWADTSRKGEMECLALPPTLTIYFQFALRPQYTQPFLTYLCTALLYFLTMAFHLRLPPPHFHTLSAVVYLAQEHCFRDRVCFSLCDFSSPAKWYLPSCQFAAISLWKNFFWSLVQLQLCFIAPSSLRLKPNSVVLLTVYNSSLTLEADNWQRHSLVVLMVSKELSDQLTPWPMQMVTYLL